MYLHVLVTDHYLKIIAELSGGVEILHFYCANTKILKEIIKKQAWPCNNI